MERVRVMAEAARTLGGLTRDERRMLARGLAERGAPDLADRLARRTGGALSGSELTDAARQLLSLDAQTLGDLGQSLRDPDERRRLLDAAVTATQDGSGDAPTSAEVPETPVGEPPPPARPSDLDAERADSGDEVDEGHEGYEASELEPHDVAVWEPQDVDPDIRGEHRSRPPAPPPATRPAVDPAAVVSSILAATTVQDRFTAVATLAGQTLDGAQLREVLTALPDGWQRRRAAIRLVTGASLSAEEAGRVVTSLARDSDRIAVASALVDADATLLDAVCDALPERAAARLARRVPPDPWTA